MHEKVLKELNNKSCFVSIGHNYKDGWLCEISTDVGFFWFTPLGWIERGVVEDYKWNAKPEYKWKSKREFFEGIKKKHTVYKKRIETQGESFCYWRYKIKLKPPHES